MSVPELGYCGDQIRRHDNDRFLVCLMAPPERRPALYALHAFNLELARTRELVAEPVLGRIRLQWWRDSIASLYTRDPERFGGERGAPAGPDGPGGQPLLGALAAAVRDYRLGREHFDRLIDARVRDLADQPPATLADLIDYAEATAAPLIHLALEVLGHGYGGAQFIPMGGKNDPLSAALPACAGRQGTLSPDTPSQRPGGLWKPDDRGSDFFGRFVGITSSPPAAWEAGGRVGIAYALTGLLRAIPFHAAQRRLYLPSDLLARHGLAPADVLTTRPAALAPVVMTVAAEARAQLAEARRLMAAIPPPLRPALLPATIADGHLAGLAACRFDVFAAVARPPSPWRPLRLAWQAWLGRY